MIICWVPSSQFYEAALLLFLIYRQINWGLEKLTGYAKYSLFAPPHPVFALPSACGGQVFRPAGAGSSSWASCWMPALGGGSRISAAWGERGHNVYFPSSLPAWLSIASGCSSLPKLQCGLPGTISYNHRYQRAPVTLCPLHFQARDGLRYYRDLFSLSWIPLLWVDLYPPLTNTQYLRMWPYLEIRLLQM